MADQDSSSFASGDTPLHTAAAEKSLVAIECLIKQGTEVMLSIQLEKLYYKRHALINHLQ